MASANNLILDIRVESVRAAENYLNRELSKITAWSKNNKIRFNEEKSKVTPVLRRKGKELKEIKVFLNNKPLEQVTQMKYLGIIIDHKFWVKEHINYPVERCTKLIYNLSKTAKISWGIKHEAMKTIQRSHPTTFTI